MALRGRLGRFEKRLAEMERARAEDQRLEERRRQHAIMSLLMSDPRSADLCAKVARLKYDGLAIDERLTQELEELIAKAQAKAATSEQKYV
jgi:hypothetical protein